MRSPEQGTDARSDRKLAILAYHAIGPPAPGGWKTWFYIPEDTFVEQLQCLSTLGWNVVDAATLTRALDEPSILPHRAALLTFDDAYRSMVDVVLPLLGRHNYPAVVFVPTAFVGGYNSFEPPGWAPREPICGWDDLNTLQENRVSIQSHGAVHRRLSELTAEELGSEIAASKDVLEQHLAVPVELFSYPYGDAGQHRRTTARVLTSARYRAAFLYDGAINSQLDGSRFFLSRLQMGPDTNLRKVLGQGTT